MLMQLFVLIMWILLFYCACLYGCDMLLFASVLKQITHERKRDRKDEIECSRKKA